MGKTAAPSKMYKFRSMVANAEDPLESFQDLNEKDGPGLQDSRRPAHHQGGQVYHAILIDEFPQFINVLLGDMSVVGPGGQPTPKGGRPVRRLPEAAPLDEARYHLYWQTRRNRDSITFDEWVDLDLLYIKQCSTWADLKLIIQTVGVVLTAQGS